MFPQYLPTTPPKYQAGQAVMSPDYKGDMCAGIVLKRRAGVCTNLDAPDDVPQPLDIRYVGRVYARDRCGCYMVRLGPKSIVFAHEEEMQAV